MNNNIALLDPYQFMAVIGKTVIHPGGKKSTDELFEFLKDKKFHNVLDIGCGVGTTAFRLASEFSCNVTGIDIDSSMINKAAENPLYNSLKEKVRFQTGDITGLNFKDNEFDAVIVEAVTMFVNREKACSEIYRVCKPGGFFIDQEFVWKKTPTDEDRRIFTKELCPGIKFENSNNWRELFMAAGFNNFQIKEGPFRLISPSGFIYDEGFLKTLAIFLKVIVNTPYLKKMIWMMKRIMKIKNKLGYCLVFSQKI
jgi:SAM-dependent methyltransferase